MGVRRVIGGLGRTMIGLGVIILLFVAYQLWGTGLAESRSQRALKREFRQQLDQATTTTTTTTPPTTVAGQPAPTTTTTLDDSAAPAPAGKAVAIIKIPRVGVEKAVVQGVTLDMLKQGPGHYPATPLPGQPGNAAIAGHRTTYGAPFFRLNELQPGDPILVTTGQGRFRYEVLETRIVKPNDTSVLRQTGDNRLTLTTCNPRFSAAQRLVVIAALKGEAAPAPPPSATTTTTTTAAPPTTVAPGEPTTVATAAPPTTVAPEGGEEGLSGRAAAKRPAILWGLLAAAVLFLTWLAGRRWNRWVAYLVGTPVFLVVLFVFFENFSRLLPSNF